MHMSRLHRKQSDYIVDRLIEKPNRGTELNRKADQARRDGTKWDEALAYAQKSLLLAQGSVDMRVLEDPYAQGIALLNLAVIYHAMDNLEDAVRYYSRSAQTFSFTDKRSEGLALLGLAMVCQELGQWDDALQAYQQSWEVLHVADSQLAVDIHRRLQRALRRFEQSSRPLSAPATDQQRRIVPIMRAQPTSSQPHGPDQRPGTAAPESPAIGVIVLGTVLLFLVVLGLGAFFLLVIFGPVASAIYVAILVVALIVTIIYGIWMRFTVLPGRVAIVERLGRRWVASSGETVIRFPFLSRVHTVVPTWELTCVCPKQRVMAKDGSLEVDAIVYYQVDQNRVMEAASQHLRDTEETGRKHRLSEANMVAVWEKRLRVEVAIVLADVLISHKLADLHRPATRERISADIMSALQDRATQWGLNTNNVVVRRFS